jgi:uncharacterized protein (TIGR02598 family)
MQSFCNYNVKTDSREIFCVSSALVYSLRMTPTHQAALPAGFEEQGFRRVGPSGGKGGFSLIEISIALAIVGVVFSVLIGLIPAGLGNYSAATNTQLSVEIYQRLAAELQETDFDTLMDSKDASSGNFHRLPLRYFDFQGQEVRVAASGSPSSDEQQRILYTARIRLSEPGLKDPSKHSSAYFTSLPHIAGKRFNPRDSTFATIQVALTQGKDIDGLIAPSTYLIDPAKAAKEGVSLRTYSLHLTRNGFQ